MTTHVATAHRLAAYSIKGTSLLYQKNVFFVCFIFVFYTVVVYLD